jgi:hypothetical protein
MPQLRDVVQDPVLSQVSTGFSNESFIADKIIPVVPVSKQSGVYFQYDKSNLRIPGSTLRAPGAPAKEVDFSVTKATYFAEDHALKEFVPVEIQEQAMTPQDPLTDATENITEMLMLDKEQALATYMANTANITNNTTLAGTSQWSDYNNSSPINDVRAARSAVKLAVGKTPNTLILGQQVFEYLCDHPEVIERVKYSALGVVTADLLARLFQVERVWIGDAIKNSAKEGQTDSLGYVWGKHAWLGFIAPSTRQKQLTFGYTFQYGARQTERWTDGDRKGTYVRVHDNYDQAIVAQTAMYLIKNAVA